MRYILTALAFIVCAGCANSPASSYTPTTQYKGQYSNGKWDGFGTYFYTGGFKYIGEFKDGIIHGEGVEYYPSGQISKEGLWVYGELKKSYSINLNDVKMKHSFSHQQDSLPNSETKQVLVETIINSKITNKLSIEEAKLKCDDLGFSLKTEKFGDCVLKLSK